MVTVYIFVAYATWTAFGLRIVFNFRLRVWLSCGHGMVGRAGRESRKWGYFKKNFECEKG
jgi:hypothetical protein